MARRGQFGRLPRTVPSLTATIISIAEQMLADQDRNIMDAWTNGGTYEGKPVTDKMVLEHWQQRLSGVSKNDPLYDTYKNNVTQLEYKIAYSKQYTRYLQGGRTDNMGMAHFFQTWAQKVPRNSDFYRTLQQDAAGYVNLARSAARAGAASAKVANYNARRAEIDREYIKPADLINSALDNYARAQGLVGQTQSIEYLSPEGTAKFYDLLANSDPNTFLYSAANGQPVTVGDIRQRIGKLSPDLKFGFTADDINRINLRAVKGSTMQIRLARANGYTSVADGYAKNRDQYGNRARESGIMSIEDQYVAAREQFNVELNDPTTGVEEKARAWETYRNTISGLGMNTTDASTRTRLMAEASGDVTQNSLAEDVFGFGKPPDQPAGSIGEAPPGIGDIANTQMQVKLLVEQQQIATDGTGVWTNGNIVPLQNASGQVVGYQFQPSPTGTVVGLTNDPAQVQRLLTQPTVSLSSPWGPDQIKDVHVQWMPVVVEGLGTATSNNAAPSTVVAQAATITVNGVPQTSYRYTNGGHTWITPYAPWSSALPVKHNDDGSITIDASALSFTGQNAVVLAKTHPNDFKLNIAGVGIVDPTQITQNADGTYTVPNPNPPQDGSAPTVTVGPGQLIQTTVTDVPGALFATDPTRAAGPSPTEDFQTLTQSMLVASPGGQEEYDKLIQDPAFKARIAAEIQVNTADPRTGYSNPGLTAAANLQAFGSSFPGLKLMADTPQGQMLFNWFVNKTQGPGGDISVAQGVNAQAQAIVQAPPNTNVPPVSAPSSNVPVPPSLANLTNIANTYAAFQRLGLLPAPQRQPTGTGKDSYYGHDVQIAPANIKVPQPPPPQPVQPMPTPQPAPPPTPIYTPPPPPSDPIYSRHHAGQGGQ